MQWLITLHPLRSDKQLHINAGMNSHSSTAFSLPVYTVQ